MGDILTTGFGYFQNFETVKYKDIDEVKLVNHNQKKAFNLVTKTKAEIQLNILVPEAEAIEIKAFLEHKMTPILYLYSWSFCASTVQLQCFHTFYGISIRLL